MIREIPERTITVPQYKKEVALKVTFFQRTKPYKSPEDLSFQSIMKRKRNDF